MGVRTWEQTNTNSCYIRIVNPLLSSDVRYFGVLQEAIEVAESFVPNATVEIARGTCSGVQLENGTYQVGYIREDLTIIGSLRRNNFTDPNDYHNINVRAVSTAIDAEGNGHMS